MEFKPEYKKKAIRSYVLRTGRMTDGQHGAFEAYWPQFGLSLHDGLLQADICYEVPQPLVLEIGFGMGDSLLQMAQDEPDKNFIGIEVHPPGVGRLLNNAGKAGIQNLKIYMADATDVLEDCIPPQSLHRFQLYFPDPWHKKKHHKRRIVQPEFIDRVTGKMQSGGLVHLATDWENYAEHMLEVLSANPALENTAPHYAPRPSFRPTTKFEMRGERLGHGVWDLVFRKK